MRPLCVFLQPLKAPEPVADAPFFIPSRFEEGKTVLLPPEAVETPEGDKSKEAPRESFKERSRKFRSQLQRLLAAKVKSDEAKYEGKRGFGLQVVFRDTRLIRVS